MSQYFNVVNLDKKQFFSPDIFNDGVKSSAIMKGTHPYVLGQLILANQNDNHENTGINDLEIIRPGLWAGDRVVILGDETGKDFFDLIKNTKNEDYQILNDLVLSEFENIGAKLICSLINDNYFKEQILLELKVDNQYFGKIGFLVYQFKSISHDLKNLLIENFGQNWEKKAKEVWEDKKTTFIEFSF